jgi:putative NADH-flavin reductase
MIPGMWDGFSTRPRLQKQPPSSADGLRTRPTLAEIHSPPMNVLVFGATGGTGREVVRQAREQGHEVTEFTRATHGDVTTDRGAVANAMRGQDAVISALGRGNSFRSEQLMSRSMDVILPAMKREGVRRLILTSAFGVGETFYEAPLLVKIFVRLALRHIYADKAIADDFVCRSGLDWTIVYPTKLTDGPRTGSYRAGEHLEFRGMPKISRADAADFIVKQLTDSTYLHKTVIVSM